MSKTKNKSTSFYINEESLEILEKYCLLTKKTKSQIVNELIKEFAKNNKYVADEVDNALNKAKKKVNLI